MKVILLLTGIILLVTTAYGIKQPGYGGPPRYGGPYNRPSAGSYHQGSGYYGGGYGCKYMIVYSIRIHCISLYMSIYDYCLSFVDKRVLCPKLKAPANGAVNVSGLYPGQKAVYSCNDGFQLVGLSVRKCQRDGKWSQEAPICKRK